MSTFKTYITENLHKMEHLTHLTHPEDQMIESGKQGFHHAIGALQAVHDKLQGKFNTTKVTEKYDGSPSLVFGHNPQNGKFFVATKSAFNKNPKVNYTVADIEKNHGHAPGLVHKLKIALEHLKKVAPKTGVYQGDVLHSHDDVHEHDGHYHFTPNTIMYSVPKKSEEGKKIEHSKLGIVIHSKYHGPSLEHMHVGFDPDLHNFKEHKDIHLVNPHVDIGVHGAKQSTAAEHHLKRAEKDMAAAHPETLDIIGHHKNLLSTYINKTVKEKTTPTTAGYRKHIMELGQKATEKVSTAKAKQRHHDAAMGHLKYAEEHHGAFDSLFKIHHHIQKAKDALVSSLHTGSKFSHSINGKETSPEGYVAVHEGHPVKLVNRSEFSHHNFLKHAVNT